MCCSFFFSFNVDVACASLARRRAVSFLSQMERQAKRQNFQTLMLPRFDQSMMMMEQVSHNPSHIPRKSHRALVVSGKKIK